jgi:UDP-N-acetylglucosamine--N-acetylmuramyl-(pentapeptide) pyrophosphoryl-undecaprenol N-acetylglucosamine transferase
MKIMFTGGGTGGHFYPIIAVTEALRDVIKEKKILKPTLYFMAPTKYDPRALFDNEIQFIGVSSGKIRRYFSILNFTDMLKTISGCFLAVIKMYSVYPDVLFAKGGYGSFPALFAAKILRIPVIIHESDSAPGRVNTWAGKFAKKVAISYPNAAKYFDQKKVALTGNPVRHELLSTLTNGAHEFLKLEYGVPVLLFLGGSQGAQNINDVLLDALPELLNTYQVIHQTGKANFEEMKSTASVILKDHKFANRYRPFDYLNILALRMSAGVADIIVSRAGSSIFEIALWGKPSIIVPIPRAVSHDQTTNAFAYAETGAASVIEEANFGSHILIEEINRIYQNKTIKDTMSQRALAFARPDSARIIAEQIINLALQHES